MNDLLSRARWHREEANRQFLHHVREAERLEEEAAAAMQAHLEAMAAQRDLREARTYLGSSVREVG